MLPPVKICLTTLYERPLVNLPRRTAVRSLAFWSLATWPLVGGLHAQPLGITLYAPADIYSANQLSDETDSAVEELTVADPGAASLNDALAAAVEQGQVSKSFRLAAKLACVDPDHAAARRILGQALHEGRWCGGYAALMLKRGMSWNSEFGWIRPDDLSKWQAGQRPWGKRWINAEEDARRHESLARGWSLRTDHFLVTTNHSREAAVRLAVRLERLYQLWRQVFGEFAASKAELRARFDGKQATGRRSKPFRVLYHRTREQYNAALRSRQPLIEMTLGIYFDRQRESHFFAGDQQDPGTIDHEAVHQFFFESRPAGRHLAALANAWATEGAACYFESLAEATESPLAGRAYTIGAPQDGRLPAARHRRLVDNFYVPLKELSALGMEDLQHRTDLPRLYSQSTGLATFLMQADQGKYRNAFRKLLLAVYAGRDDAGTLQDQCGTSYSALDAEYRHYLEALPSE